MNRAQLIGAYLVFLVPLGMIFVTPYWFGWALAQSETQAGVPAAGEFDELLKRDIGRYFRHMYGRPLKIRCELLRKTPTQSGLAYPKFYGWVQVFDNGTLLTEGAVRLSAVEKAVYEVTDYCKKEGIVKDPTSIDSVFPAALCPEIRKRANSITPPPSAAAPSN